MIGVCSGINSQMKVLIHTVVCTDQEKKTVQVMRELDTFPLFLLAE